MWRVCGGSTQGVFQALFYLKTVLLWTTVVSLCPFQTVHTWDSSLVPWLWPLFAELVTVWTVRQPSSKSAASSLTCLCAYFLGCSAQAGSSKLCLSVSRRVVPTLTACGCPTSATCPVMGWELGGWDRTSEGCRPSTVRVLCTLEVKSTDFEVRLPGFEPASDIY